MFSQRIRQARLMAGMSQEELAARLTELNHPLTKQAISKYENGDMLPKPTTIFKLAQALHVDTTYLLETPTLHVDWLAFRRRVNLSASTEERIKSYGEFKAEQQFNLQQLLHPAETPHFPTQQRVTTVEDAERAAEALRAAWHLDDHPIENLLGMIEDHGGIVIEWIEATTDFDALLGVGNNAAPIIVVNRTVPPDQLRFNVAHELGHLCMDMSGIAEDELEKLVNRFAAAFLVPASVARRELAAERHHIDWLEIGILKQKYGMSMASWLLRTKELAIISESLYKVMRRERSDNHWWMNEPSEYDYAGHETILRFKQMVLHAAAERLISDDHARKLCPDCFEPVSPVIATTSPHLTARELLKLPREERDRIMSETLEQTWGDFDIEVFEANSEADFDDDDPSYLDDFTR